MALTSVVYQTATPATPPNLTKVAADILAGGEAVQYVKLVDGLAGQEAPIRGDSTNGLWVNLKQAVNLTVDTELPTAVALTDATPNPTSPMVGAALMVANGAGNWERVKSFDLSGGAQTVGGINALQKIFDGGAAAYPVMSAAAMTDGSSGTYAPASVPYVYNGTSYDRLRGTAAGGLWANVKQWGGQVVNTGGGTIAAAPGANGTLRVVIATDQPAFSTAMPVSVAVLPSHSVTNVGTFAVQDSEKITDDNALFVGFTKLMPVGYFANETATDSVNEGDLGAARMTLDRVQRVVMEYEGAFLREAGAQLTIKRAKIGAHAAGNNPLVTAVAAKRIRVLSMFVIAGAASSIYFSNQTTGAVFGDATDTIDLLANEAFVLPFNPAGWFQTGTVNEDLRLVTSGAQRMSGGLVYVEI